MEPPPSPPSPPAPRDDTTTTTAFLGHDLYTIEPTAPHAHSVILLHGLGARGVYFAHMLLSADNGKLTKALPDTRFVFPTAPRRRCLGRSRASPRAWFARAADPARLGLAATARLVRALVLQEVEALGGGGSSQRKNVVAGGLSQGCAAGLAALLTLDGKGEGGEGEACGGKVGGFFGMSGWFPLQKDVEGILGLGDSDGDGGNGEGVDNDDEDDIFDRGEESSEEPMDPAVQAIRVVREFLDADPFPMSQTPDAVKAVTSIPIFLGHGDKDEKVDFALGEGAARTFHAMGFNVTWRRFEGQSHWVDASDHVDALLSFLRSKVGWTIHSRDGE